jgi:hypothetical protein
MPGEIIYIIFRYSKIDVLVESKQRLFINLVLIFKTILIVGCVILINRLY